MREPVGAEEGRVHHAGGAEHPVLDELVVADATGPLRQQGKHDEPAVAVAEPLAGQQLLRVSLQRGEECLGRVQLVRRPAHHVVIDVAELLLVQVVTDAGAVAEQVLDGHGVVDLGQIVAQQRSRGQIKGGRAVADEAHDDEGGHALAAAGHHEPGRHGVGYLVCPIGHAERPPPVADGRDAGNPVVRASAST
jgi:hypothetical protein